MDFTKNLDVAMNHLSTTGAFLTSKSADGVNTMTISWGFIGFLWNKPYFIVTARPQRRTNAILEGANSFTVSVPYGNMAKELDICGTKTGWEINKSEIVDFVNSKHVDSPVVKGCSMYYECKIGYVDKFEESKLLDAIKSQFYENDYHILYYGEIVDCYENLNFRILPCKAKPIYS